MGIPYLKLCNAHKLLDKEYTAIFIEPSCKGVRIAQTWSTTATIVENNCKIVENTIHGGQEEIILYEYHRGHHCKLTPLHHRIPVTANPKCKEDNSFMHPGISEGLSPKVKVPSQQRKSFKTTPWIYNSQSRSPNVCFKEKISWKISDSS